MRQFQKYRARARDYWFRDAATYEFFIWQQFAHQQKKIFVKAQHFPALSRYPDKKEVSHVGRTV